MGKADGLLWERLRSWRARVPHYALWVQGPVLVNQAQKAQDCAFANCMIISQPVRVRGTHSSNRDEWGSRSLGTYWILNAAGGPATRRFGYEGNIVDSATRRGWTRDPAADGAGGAVQAAGLLQSWYATLLDRHGGLQPRRQPGLGSFRSRKQPD